MQWEGLVLTKLRPGIWWYLVRSVSKYKEERTEHQNNSNRENEAEDSAVVCSQPGGPFELAAMAEEERRGEEDVPTEMGIWFVDYVMRCGVPIQ